MVKNSYLEGPLERIKQHKPLPRNIHLAMFLTVRDDVREALVVGYAVKTIWAHLVACERIHCSYSRFLYHVKCMRCSDPSTLRPAVARTVALIAGTGRSPMPECDNTASGERLRSAASESSDPRGFVFNPVPDPKKLF